MRISSKLRRRVNDKAARIARLSALIGKGRRHG